MKNNMLSPLVNIIQYGLVMKWNLATTSWASSGLMLEGWKTTCLYTKVLHLYPNNKGQRKKPKKPIHEAYTSFVLSTQDGFHRYILFIVEGWIFAPLHHHQQIFCSSPSPKMLIQTKLWNKMKHHHHHHFKFLRVHTRTSKGKTSGNLEWI